MSTIPEFFRGKNVLITGGSGFIGKALIEKLLRSCPDVGIIYVLVRSKKNKTIQQRVEEIVNNVVFSVVRERNPSLLNKVVGIPGDIEEIGLGISKEDEQLLISDLDVIYNCAATVRFDCSIQKAVFSNVRSVRELCNLALKCKHIKCLVHTSTAYCNLQEDHVEEILYPPLVDWSDLIESVEDESKIREVDKLTEKMIAPFPNTYTFTKKIAEQVLSDMCKDKIPSVIARPSIVMNSLREPFIGYADNLNGPFGISAAMLKGIVEILYIPDKHGESNFVFVDNVVKALIAATWQKCSQSKNLIKIDIFNLCSDMHWRTEGYQTIKRIAQWKVPLEGRLWHAQGGSIFTMCWYSYYIRLILFNVIPSIFLDLILVVIGRKPILSRLQVKIYQANNGFAYFLGVRKFSFGVYNYKHLDETLSKEDKEEFSTLTWIEPTRENHIKIGMDQYVGIKRYVFKEKYPVQPETFANTRKLFVLHLVVRSLFYGVLLYYLWKSNRMRYLVDTIYKYFLNRFV